MGFLPPGGWIEQWCELSGDRGGTGGRGEEKGGRRAPVPPGSFDAHLASLLSFGPFWLLIADDNYCHHYCYLHQRVRLL